MEQILSDISWSIAYNFQAFLYWVWTNWNAITVFTGALVIVGGLQCYVYWRQALYMRKALGFTRQAAEAATASADISAKSLTLLERPWIHIDFNRPFQPTTGRQLYQFTISNTGRTPAKLKRHGFALQWHVAMPTYPIAQKDTGELPTEALVHPNQSLTLGFDVLPFSQSDLNDIIQGRQILAVFGSVLYDDIFSVRHITRFCRIYSKVHPNGTGRFILPYDARPEYNESD